MTLKSEVLSLFFGVLLILITFGDDYLKPFIGNLDTIFGLQFWKALDTIYPLAAIAVFLLYGWVKGKGLKFNAVTIFLFISFLSVLFLINIDDFAQVFNLALKPSGAYWVLMMWVYPVGQGRLFSFLDGSMKKTNRSPILYI